MDEILKLKSDAVEWREIEGEVVAIDRRTDTYLGVNESGAKLWRALAAGATREQLVDELVSAFEIPREQAAADADAFVRHLAEHELLTGP
jgi:Coenzyme PQQ synthesis protein D (PqqD)